MVNAVAFSPRGDKLAAGDTNGHIKIWDVATGQTMGEPFLHRDYVNELAYSPDGAFLASVSGDKTLVIWDLVSATPYRTVPHPDVVWDVAFSANGNWVATACADGSFYLHPIHAGDLMELAEKRFEAAGVAIPRTR
jgi:WD40 repeat protein